MQLAQAAIAVQKFQTEMDVSKAMKTFFDSKYGPNWHCVVGKHFAHYGSYEANTYIFFHVGQIALLLYRMN